jgi:tetratricopeptide (TPR) repeat protein
LRVTGRMATQFEADLQQSDLRTVCLELVEKASTHILKYTEPIALELYYSNVKHDGPNTVKMAQYLMDNFPDDSEMVRHAYDSWAWGLVYENKLDEAETKIKEGLAKYPNEERLYNAWGSVYAGQGKDEQAIEKYKTVLSLIKETDRRKKRMVAIYSNIGISFAYLGQLDSAMSYFKQALTMDKDDWILHYNIGGLYLLKKDTAQFLSRLETALENGADVGMIRGDADLKPMMTDKRVMELLKKYSD